MARILTCDIVTPERQLYSSEAAFVVAPGSDGELGIMPMHVPLVSTLGAGEVRVTLPGENSVDCFVISGGYLQVQADDRVIVLADRAMKVDDIDIDAARGAVGELALKVERLGEDSPNLDFLSGELEWARLQVQMRER
jgi:F-type H+-transporting ATPase subunit epsilon